MINTTRRIVDINLSDSQQQEQQSMDLQKNPPQNPQKSQIESKTAQSDNVKNQYHDLQTQFKFSLKSNIKVIKNQPSYKIQKRNQKILNKQKKKINFLNNFMSCEDLQQIQLQQRKYDQRKIYNQNEVKNQQSLSSQVREDSKIIFKQESLLINQGNCTNDYKIEKLMSEYIQNQSDKQLLNIIEDNSSYQKPKMVFQQVIQHQIQQQKQSKNSRQSKQSKQSRQRAQGSLNIFSGQLLSQDYHEQIFQFFSYLLCSEQSQTHYNRNVKYLLLKPIPKNKIFTFVVHVYKDILKTQYQLWIQLRKQLNDNNPQMILIARAYNPNINIDKSVFVIEQIGKGNQKIFIAEIQSNFARNCYVMNGYFLSGQDKVKKNNKDDHQSYSQQSQFQKNTPQLNQNRQYQHKSIQQLLNSIIDINRTVYIPKQIYFQEKSNLQNQSQTKRSIKQKQPLRNFYQRQKDLLVKIENRKIQKLISNKYFPELNHNNFYRQYQIRQSNKTLLMIKSHSKNHALFIGKIASKKYKLIVAQDLSPLQAFSFLITHVQNN